MNSLDYSKVVEWIISRDVPDCFGNLEKMQAINKQYGKEAQKRTNRLISLRKDYENKNEKQRLRYTPYIVTYILELARCTMKEEPAFAEIMMYCNKSKFNVDINPWTNLPKTYGIGHTSSIVIGGIDQCGENLFVNHGVTVGRFGNSKPKIGKNVLLMPHCMVVGRTLIGDGSVISAGVRINNMTVPPQSLVVAESNDGRLVIKKIKRDYISEYLRINEVE